MKKKKKYTIKEQDHKKISQADFDSAAQSLLNMPPQRKKDSIDFHPKNGDNIRRKINNE